MCSNTATGKLSHRLAALSSSGPSLEVGSPLCALRPRLAAHHLSAHLTCRLPLQTNGTCLNWESRHLSQTNHTSCVTRNHYTCHGWVCTEENTGNRCILINDTAEATDTDFPGAARAVTAAAIPSPSVKAGFFSEHHRAPTVASLSGPVPQAYTRGDRKKYSRSRTTCNPGRGKEGRQGAASVSIADVLV